MTNWTIEHRWWSRWRWWMCNCASKAGETRLVAKTRARPRCVMVVWAASTPGATQAITSLARAANTGCGVGCFGIAIGLVWYGVVLVWYKLPTQGACRIHLLTIYCLLKWIFMSTFGSIHTLKKSAIISSVKLGCNNYECTKQQQNTQIQMQIRKLGV